MQYCIHWHIQYAGVVLDRHSSRKVLRSMTEPALSLTDEAHRRIRSDIIAGRIRPNVHLVAWDWANQLKISRPPVREALQLLASEGLVIGTRRGFVVREHSV